MHLEGRLVLIVGAGRSGCAAAKLCHAHGAQVVLADCRHATKLEAASSLPQAIKLALGPHDRSTFLRSQLIVVSPGVPPLEELQAAEAAGIPIISEIELSAGFIKAPIIGITGTNGKSTTTALIGQMLLDSGAAVAVGGNLGVPLAELVLTDAAQSPSGRVVVELSSFQLERVASFVAHIAVLLNLGADHLDRYPSLEAYVAAKARIFERQRASDYALVSAEAEQVKARELASASSAQQLTFGIRPGAQHGAWVDDEALVIGLPGEEIERYSLKTLQLSGQHNQLNALAALLAARLAGATQQGCRRALAQFQGLPHRMQFIGERRGVRYYDDSKATNAAAVVGSLRGFSTPIVLIAGGVDKGDDYDELAKVAKRHCRLVILIGAAADRLAAALTDAVQLRRATSLEQAVVLAASLARAGDTVLLSPACSSYDMFENFEARGCAFQQAVASLTSNGQ